MVLSRPSTARRLSPRAFGSQSIRFNSPAEDDTELSSTAESRVIEVADNILDKLYYNNLVKAKYIVLGKSVLQSSLIEHLLNTYQHLEASEIADLALHFTKEILPLANRYASDANCTLPEKRANMYAEIGMLYERDGQSAVFDHLKSLNDYQLSVDAINIYCKLAHPKSTLDAIMHSKGLPFELQRTGKRSVGIFVNGTMAKESTGSTLERAEYQVCLSYIREHHLSDVKNVTLEPLNKVYKRRFRGKLSGQRVVTLSKTEDQQFGLFLKGGEYSTIETDTFFRYNHIEPVYISTILPGSPAAKTGFLQEGDIILAVGDFTLSGLTLESAVSLINREESVTLTVKYDKTIKLKEKFKSEFKERESKAFKDTLKIDDWRKWHEANLKDKPGRYVDVQ